MNANGTRGPRFGSLALAMGILAPMVARAEVGVAITGNASDPLVVYVVNGSTEDPSPINPVWRKLNVNDTYRLDLNRAGEARGDGTPSLVSDPVSGLVAAAWSRNSASGFDVVVSRFVNGAWSPEQVVAASPINDLDPQLLVGPDGTVHLLYWTDGATPQVFHVTAPPDLSAWSTAEPVSPQGQSACRPTGVFHDGVLHVAYELHDFGYGNAPREVVIARLEGGAFVPEVVATTDNLNDARPQVHSHAGHLWVDWVDAETSWGSGEIAWTRLSSAGQWEPIHYEPFGDREQRDYLTRGAARLKAVQ